MKNLNDAFLEELERARMLLQEYINIGPVGRYGAIIINQSINRAEEAQSSGDITKILASYEDLKGLE